MATSLFIFHMATSSPTTQLFLLQLFHAVLTAPLVPLWVSSLSDWHFIQFLSNLHLFLWSMEGKLRPSITLLQSLLWSTIADCFPYGAFLAPVSVLYRLLGIFLILFGLMPQGPVYRPSVRDVRFWFDTNLDIDLSYLWTPHTYRKKPRCSRMPQSFHLRLRIQCRVKWIPIRDPVLSMRSPST